MNVTKIIDAFGYVIYAALALLAVWGVYNGILLYRGLLKKSIRDPADLDRPGSRFVPGAAVRLGDQPLPEPALLAHGPGAIDRGGAYAIVPRGWPRSSSLWSPSFTAR